MMIKNANPSTLGGIFGLVLIAGTTVAKCVQAIASGSTTRQPCNSSWSNGQGGGNGYIPYTAYQNNNYRPAPTIIQYPCGGYNNANNLVSYFGGCGGMNGGYDPLAGSRRNMTSEQYQAIVNAYGAPIMQQPVTSSYTYGYGYSDPDEYVHGTWRYTDAVQPTTAPDMRYSSIVAPQYTATQQTQYTPIMPIMHTTDPEGLNVVPGPDPTSRRYSMPTDPMATCATTANPMTPPTGFEQPMYQNPIPAPAPAPVQNTCDWNEQIRSKITPDNDASNFWSSRLVPIGQSQNPQQQYQSMFQYQQMPMNQFQPTAVTNPYGMNNQYSYGYGYGLETYGNDPSTFNLGYNPNPWATNQQFQTPTNTDYNGYNYGYNDPVQYSYGGNQGYTGFQNQSDMLYGNQFAGNNTSNNQYGWNGHVSTDKPANADMIFASDWLRFRHGIDNFDVSEDSKKSYYDENYGRQPVNPAINRPPMMQQPVQQMGFPQVYEPRQARPDQYQQQFQNLNNGQVPNQVNNNNQQYQGPVTKEQPQQMSACDRFFCDIPTTVIPEQNKMNASEQQQKENGGSPSLAGIKIPENGWFKFGNDNPITTPVSPSVMPGKGNPSQHMNKTPTAEEPVQEEQRFPTLAEVRAQLGAEEQARMAGILEGLNKSKSDEKSIPSVEGATPAFIMS